MSKELKLLDYDAIVANSSELANFALVEPLGDLMISANSGSSRRSYRVSERSGRSFAIIGWTDAPALREYDNSIWLLPQAHRPDYSYSRLQALVTELHDKGDVVIIAGDIHPMTIRRLSQSHEPVAAILTNYSLSEAKAFGFLGNTFVMQQTTGLYGPMVVRAGLSARGVLLNPRVSSHQLDDSMRDDLDTRVRLDAAYNSPEFLRIVQTKEVPSPRTRPGSADLDTQYIGSFACATCHAKQYVQWRSTAHSTAMSTLRRVHRERHPTCVGCHAVGFGAPSGFSSSAPAERKRILENVGCESCHGPGSLHAERPSRQNIDAKVSRTTCEGCHTEERSAFSGDPGGYRDRIVHIATPLSSRVLEKSK